MKTRTWAVLIIAALISTGIGALAVQAVSEDRPAPIRMPTSESGAIQHFEAARLHAAEWREDATLVRVGATEGPQVDGRIDPPFLWDTSGDGFVGNGAALVWTFGFASPERPHVSFWVSLGGDGSLLYARELADPYYCCVDYVVAHSEYTYHDDGTTTSYSSSPEPVLRLPSVSADIDAPAAMAAVLDHPAFVNFSLDHPVFQANIELVPGYENHSIWYLGYRTATYYGAGAAVDAHTGEVLHVGGWPTREPCCEPVPPTPHPPTPPEPCCKPDDVRAEYSGSLNSWGAYDVSFPVDDVNWLDQIHVVATVSEGLPQDSFRLDLMDSYGRIVARAEGSDLLEISLPSGPTSGGYTALVTRDSEVGGPTLLPVQEAYVTVAVAVTYADAPVERPLVHAFYGDVWPNSETWHDLYVQGKEWRPMRPVQLTLGWDATRVGEALELVLLDTWGNEIASAKGDALATGYQSVTLDVPRLEDDCCMTALVRGPTGLFGPSIPYTLELLVEPWYDEPLHEAHPVHATHDDHDH